MAFFLLPTSSPESSDSQPREEGELPITVLHLLGYNDWSKGKLHVSAGPVRELPWDFQLGQREESVFSLAEMLEGRNLGERLGSDSVTVMSVNHHRNKVPHGALVDVGCSHPLDLRFS